MIDVEEFAMKCFSGRSEVFGFQEGVRMLTEHKDSTLISELSKEAGNPSTDGITYCPNGNIIISREFAEAIEDEIFDALCKGHPNDVSGAYMFSRALHSLVSGKPNRVIGYIKTGISELEERTPKAGECDPVHVPAVIQLQKVTK